MIPALIQLIIWLLIVGILYWLVVYVVDNFIPDPPGRAIKVVVLVVLLVKPSGIFGETVTKKV